MVTRFCGARSTWRDGALLVTEARGERSGFKAKKRKERKEKEVSCAAVCRGVEYSQGECMLAGQVSRWEAQDDWLLYAATILAVYKRERGVTLRVRERKEGEVTLGPSKK